MERKQRTNPHLGSIYTDYSVAFPGAIKEERHGHSLFTGWKPIFLGGGINLEDMGSGGEDWLLPVGYKTKQKRRMHESLRLFSRLW